MFQIITSWQRGFPVNISNVTIIIRQLKMQRFCQHGRRVEVNQAVVDGVSLAGCTVQPLSSIYDRVGCPLLLVPPIIPGIITISNRSSHYTHVPKQPNFPLLFGGHNIICQLHTENIQRGHHIAPWPFGKCFYCSHYPMWPSYQDIQTRLHFYI